MDISKSFVTFIASGILLATSASGQGVHKYRESFSQFAGVQAVTGREARFVEFLKSQLPAGAKAAIDNMGNLTVQIGAQPPQLLIVTSVDEPGYVVTDITDEGYLRVESTAGRGATTLFHQFHEGHYVDISAAAGTIRGVVAIPSTHIFRGHRENLTTEKFLIDIGARSKEEAFARGVQTLDPVAAVKDIAFLAGNRMAGPMLSRKFGAFALVEALKNCTSKQASGVVFAWATQSAMRNSGVARLARKYSPKEVLIVGSFRRAEDRRTHAVTNPVDTLDRGVLIPDGNASPLLRAASGVKITSSPTGPLPEIRSFAQTKADVLPVAIPVKYPDTLVEVIGLDDLDQLIQFVTLVAATPLP